MSHASGRIALALFALLPAQGPAAPENVSLAGDWRVALDAEARGESERWFSEALPGSRPMELPGTTDGAGIGLPLDPTSGSYPVELPRVKWPSAAPIRRAEEAGHLVRERLWIGKAWYQREVEIPPGWQGKHLRLSLERTIWATKVWLDDRCVGERDSLVAPHRYDLGLVGPESVEPGRRRVTIRVDNGPVHSIGVIGHAYGPETQSRWNGVVGAIELVATDPVFLDAVRIRPSPDRRRVAFRIAIRNALPVAAEGTLRGAIRSERGEGAFGETRQELRIAPGEQAVEGEVLVNGEVEPWDEFRPKRYRLDLSLRAEAEGRDLRHDRSELFGFRHIAREGRHIRVNGRRVFLRGTLDCCVYPRTGHPPTSVDEWLRVLETVRAYGFNHVRYHTWCPPEAAFEAADRLGLYLAPETPFWVDDWTVENTPGRPQPLGRDPDVLEYVRAEMRRMVEAYGNHPSFAMLSIGNEFGMKGTDWDAVGALLAEAKRDDDRRIYNASTARRRVSADDYWPTHSTGTAGTRGVGPPHTDWDFSSAAGSVDLPIVAHETGQRPIFPDYDRLLPKFTGPLKPLNYERLRARLESSGLRPQAAAFQRASARFQLVQYKAEHEAMLRTSDYAGYQLLMLNDFTGQSEALVGVLDPFWEPKGIVSLADVRRWNSPTVPLARFARTTWATDQTFEATLDVAHYAPADLEGAVARWSLETAAGRRLASGEIGRLRVPTGGLTRIGPIQASLAPIERATSLTLEVEIAGAANRWSLWAYPSAGDEPSAGDVLLSRRYDEEARRALAAGRRVLLFVHGHEGTHAARTGFLSVYWSAGWWGNRFSSLGILCDPAHPALADFPTDGHSDWQWHELVEGATTLDLEGAPAGFRPIVQPVTDFHHLRLLAQVLEARVGPGRLLVVGYDLERDLERRHAARQLRRSLLRYANGSAFEPTHVLEDALLERWLAPR